MPKIKISEYLLNKHGVRLKDLPAGLTEEEYNKAVVEAMRTCIPQLADNFILTDDDSVDSMIAKLRLLEENPSIDTNSAYHTKFKVFMNRYTYDYANCLAAPKKVTMQIKDMSSFLYDDKYAVNRIGVYKLTAELNLHSKEYEVSYTHYNVNADGYIEDTFKTSTDAKLIWEPLNRRFEIIIGTSTNAKFLQNTEYDVYIDWCGSNFINFEEPAYEYDPYSSRLPNIDSLTKYDRICEHPEVNGWVQKYLEDLITYYSKSENISIVLDNPDAFQLDGVVCVIDGTKNLIISNYGKQRSSNNSNNLFSPILAIYNVENVTLINCNTNYLLITDCTNINIIDCNFLLGTINQDHSEVYITNCKNVKFSKCSFDDARMSTTDTYLNSIEFNHCNFSISDSCTEDFKPIDVYSNSLSLFNSVFTTAHSDMSISAVVPDDSTDLLFSNVIIITKDYLTNTDQASENISLFKGVYKQ